MQRVYGELKGSSVHQQPIKSPVISITDRLKITLEYNDVPVTVFYKSGNYPWQSILINNTYRDSLVPRDSDIYLQCKLTQDQRVVYDIAY